MQEGARLTTTLTDEANERLKSLIDLVGPDGLDQLVVEMIAARVQAELYLRDIEHAAAPVIQDAGDEQDQGAFMASYKAWVDRRAKARQDRIDKTGTEWLLLHGRSDQDTPPAAVAAALLALATNIAASAPHVDETTIAELDEITDDVRRTAFAPTEHRGQHVSWMMPRDLDCLLHTRAEVYTTTMGYSRLRRELDQLRDEVAAFAAIAPDMDWRAFYKQFMSGQLMGGEMAPRVLSEQYPQVARDLIGLVERRSNDGGTKTIKQHVLDVARDLSVAYARDIRNARSWLRERPEV